MVVDVCHWVEVVERGCHEGVWVPLGRNMLIRLEELVESHLLRINLLLVHLLLRVHHHWIIIIS